MVDEREQRVELGGGRGWIILNWLNGFRLLADAFLE